MIVHGPQVALGEEMGGARSGRLEAGGAGQSGSVRDKELLAVLTVAGGPLPEAAEAGLGGPAGCWDPWGARGHSPRKEPPSGGRRRPKEGL